MGILQPPPPQHFFAASLGVAQPVPSTTLTTVLWDTVNKITDGSSYDPLTGHFTPGILGWWNVQAFVYVTPADPGMSLRIDVAKSDLGINTKNFIWIAPAASDLQVAISAPVEILTPADIIAIRLFSLFGFDTSTDGDPLSTSFTASYICPS